MVTAGANSARRMYRELHEWELTRHRTPKRLFYEALLGARESTRLKLLERSLGRSCEKARICILTYFIEVEGVLPRYRAVESRFQETRPSVAKCVRPALIVLTDSTNPRVDRLK
jgi:hypothetical protein